MENLLKAGIATIFIGFIMLLLGIVLTIFQGSSESQFGGIIMLGPIPIVFGSSPEITTTMLVIGLLIMIIYLFLWKMKQ
jgi:uncharacterized protein (TIGR00304 family)